MTLRKFLRFFKHFPRYMRYDIMWLKNKVFKKKTRKDDDMPEEITKAFKKIKRKTNADHFICIGNKYYVPYKKKPWDFYEITYENNHVHISNGVEEKLIELPPFAYKSGIVYTWLSKFFDSYGYDFKSFDDEMFAIRIKRLKNTSVVESGDLHKVYVKHGAQPPRLRYTIYYLNRDNGKYDVRMHDSRNNSDMVYHLSYDPLMILR